MSIKYKTIRIEKYCFDELDVCKEEYLKHHKEMVGVFITRSKILKEIIEFYLRN